MGVMMRLDLRITASEADFAYGSNSGVENENARGNIFPLYIFEILCIFWPKMTLQNKHFTNDLRAKIYVSLLMGIMHYAHYLQCAMINCG